MYEHPIMGMEAFCKALLIKEIDNGVCGSLGAAERPHVHTEFPCGITIAWVRQKLQDSFFESLAGDLILIKEGKS